MVKNPNVGKKSKFWSKIRMLVKNRNISQKSKFSSKIEIFVKNWNFRQKSTFWSKMKILVKNRHLRSKPNCRSKIENCYHKSNFHTNVIKYLSTIPIGYLTAPVRCKRWHGSLRSRFVEKCNSSKLTSESLCLLFLFKFKSAIFFYKINKITKRTK